jgi:hypothetical protein
MGTLTLCDMCVCVCVGRHLDYVLTLYILLLVPALIIADILWNEIPNRPGYALCYHDLSLTNSRRDCDLSNHLCATAAE